MTLKHLFYLNGKIYLMLVIRNNFQIHNMKKYNKRHFSLIHVVPL